MLLEGVGVDHEELVALAEKHFAGHAVWGSSPLPADNTPALYTGGVKEVCASMMENTLNLYLSLFFNYIKCIGDN